MTPFCPPTGYQTRDYGSDQSNGSCDGRRYDIAYGEIDIGNAETNLTTQMRENLLQAIGIKAVEPTMDVEPIGRGGVYRASLPLDAKVQFMTIVATKMPYIGRGYW